MLFKLIGGHFLTKAVKEVKAGNTLRCVGDNWNLRVLNSHMRKGIDNKTLNLFATSIIVNRTNFSMLDNSRPKRDIHNCKKDVFALTALQAQEFTSNVRIIIGRILVKFCPAFKSLNVDDVIPKHIKHQFWDEMQRKSTIIPCPILDANEQSYEDCVLILRASYVSTFNGFI